MDNKKTRILILILIGVIFVGFGAVFGAVFLKEINNKPLNKDETETQYTSEELEILNSDTMTYILEDDRVTYDIEKLNMVADYVYQKYTEVGEYDMSKTIEIELMDEIEYTPEEITKYKELQRQEKINELNSTEFIEVEAPEKLATDKYEYRLDCSGFIDAVLGTSHILGMGNDYVIDDYMTDAMLEEKMLYNGFKKMDFDIGKVSAGAILFTDRTIVYVKSTDNNEYTILSVENSDFEPKTLTKEQLKERGFTKMFILEK